MSRLIVPSRKLWTPPQRQRGVMVLDAYRFGGGPGPLPSVTWNPSDVSSRLELSNGNLTATRKYAVTNSYGSGRATHGKSAGKHYFEVRLDQASSGPYAMIGVANNSVPLNASIGVAAYGWAYYQQTGTKWSNNVETSYGASYTTGDVIGVLLDASAGTLEFTKNGVSQGVAFSGLSGELFPAISLYTASPVGSEHSATGRFRSSDFSYTPPSGYSPWGG